MRFGNKRLRASISRATLLLGLLLTPWPSPGQTGPEGPTPIFSDDFESGTYFRWSAAEFGAADTEAPVIFLRAPERPAVYNEDRPGIELGYFDLDSGLELSSLEVALDGVDLLPGCTVGADSVICTSGPLALGTHEITASIWDLAGNRDAGTWSFEVAVDSIAPTVGIRFWDATGPDQNIIYNEETPVFNLYFEDDLAGVNPDTVLVTVDGATPVGCVTGGESAFCETPVLAGGLIRSPWTFKILAAIRPRPPSASSSTSTIRSLP